MNDKKADLGMNMLLDENATHTLEIEYNHDMEQVFIQLRSKKDGKCIVLDADSIFEQAYDVLSKKENDVDAQYVIHMNLDGSEFSGSPEDVARWYCKQEDIRLYIEPNLDGNEKSYVLLATFDFPFSTTRTHIANFEKGLDDNDIETAYRLFFTKYMCVPDNPDYVLTEIS